MTSDDYDAHADSLGCWELAISEIRKRLIAEGKIEMPRVHCHRCKMSFEVREPSAQAERMICPERGCKRPFSCGGEPATNTVRACVAPENAHLFSDKQPEMHRARIVE